jgi:hypothetical protein
VVPSSGETSDTEIDGAPPLLLPPLPELLPDPLLEPLLLPLLDPELLPPLLLPVPPLTQAVMFGVPRPVGPS